jgi:hypothetical protein
MLRARRRGLFRRVYELDENGRSLGELRQVRREGAEFTVDGEQRTVQRERSKRFQLNGPQGSVATADRETHRRWMITTPNDRFELVRPSFWRSAWELHHGGATVGRLEPEGWFGGTSRADLPANLPLALRVFVYYVVLVQWERANAAAAAS